MFNLSIKYILNLGIHLDVKHRDLDLENLISKEMRALVKKIEEIEKEERIQNNELWKATIMSTVMGIANIMLERNSHTKIFSCTRILPMRFWTLLRENNILLKESDEGKLRIRHEMFASFFLVYMKIILIMILNYSMSTMDTL
jgi:hypothetical protein